EGLVAAGTSFFALFAQAGASSSDPSNIWFRDPPPAPAAADPSTAGTADEGNAATLSGLSGWPGAAPGYQASAVWGAVDSSTDEGATSAAESDAASRQSLGQTAD